MNRTRILLVALAATLAALVAALSGGSATAVSPADALPDLVADPPTRPVVVDTTYNGGAHDLLVRFDGYVHNIGPGAFEVEGARDASNVMQPLQRVYRTDNTYHDDAMPGGQLVYSDADGHHHFHLQHAAKYSLWAGDRSAQVAPAMKVGFCMGDSEHVETDVGPTQPSWTATTGPGFCDQYDPGAATVDEGVSAGWRDMYGRGLYFQWVVASDVSPGLYWLREDVDPDKIVHEADENNPPAWSASEVTIPGYVAQALTPPAGGYDTAQQVTLAADQYGSPGARKFKVVTPPAHGTLDVASGAAFEGPGVTYTPDAGYVGPDRFVYEALDSLSPYPLHPAKATVALGVGAGPHPSVAIENAPSAIPVGHGVQLQATVSQDLQGVVWSIDGIDGGNAQVGTISSDGFYTAPAAVPPGGQVTIAATSASGAHDQRSVKITNPLPPPPSPWIADDRRHGDSLLTGIGEAVGGNLLIASVTPRRGGLVSVNAHAAGRLLGTCRSRVPRGRQVTCQLNVAPGTSLRHLKVVARLFRHGRVIARVSRVGAPARRSF